MLKKSVLLITSLLALSFIACSSTSIQKDVKPTKPNVSLQNTYWKAISLYDIEVKTSKKEAHIMFEKNGSINGNLGCNNFFGNFKIENENISFEKVASTKMMCRDMKTEANFSKILHNTKRYEINGETLSFFDDENKKISTFTMVYF